MLATQRNMHQRLVTLFEAGPKDAEGRPALEALQVGGRRQPFDVTGWEGFRDADDGAIHQWFVDANGHQAAHLSKLLLRKRWAVVMADEPTFITTDAPVMLAHPERPLVAGAPRRFGFGTPGTIVSVPVSPTRILVMDDRHDQSGGLYYPLRPGAGAAANLIAWLDAYRFMFSSRPTYEVLSELVTLDVAMRQDTP